MQVVVCERASDGVCAGVLRYRDRHVCDGIDAVNELR